MMKLTRAVLILILASVSSGIILTGCVKSVTHKSGAAIYLKNYVPTTIIYIGDKFEEPGYTAVDSKGEDITDRVKVSMPDISHPGNYKVKYSVKDAKGSKAFACRYIYVIHRPQTSEGRKKGLSVIMYHEVYDASNPPPRINSNYISTDALSAQLNYLVSAGYYFPTWEEVRDYIDGKIDLPLKSVVLTFDDAGPGFLTYGAPLIEKYDVRATSFVIASWNGSAMVNKKYKHIWLESHSYNMHRGGGSTGHGGIFTAMSLEDGVADLKRSQEVLGTSSAFAYPFGDYNDNAIEAVRKAGFKLAFTTEPGKIYPDDDPYRLKRVREMGNLSVEDFKKLL